ncbi:MAG TPA: HPF/RaiA family ribosome-associated protein [Steroidobacteraceae bacterium]|jgi:ribosome-associated translation inhibitor RaiA|nr:HPF/RaiA family ribosome-associated protein [Steroidobacteraceae bacterium]
MQIRVNSDHHITGDERMNEIVTNLVTDAVGRYADRITRVEVHLNDVNAAKHGERDKRCMMEARIGGLAPIAVTHEADSLQLAMEGAAEKLERAVSRALGKLADSKGPAPQDRDVATTEDLQRLEVTDLRRRRH